MKSGLKILVVGSGGREHALVWKLAQSPRADKIWCAPGNAGIAEQAECVPISVSDLAGLADFAQGKAIDLTVVGPELPLAQGIVDLFQERGLRAFGPNRAAALIESSKVWCKQLLTKYEIPTGCFATFSRPEEALSYLGTQSLPIVVKADGLAAGKGVTVAQTYEEAKQAIEDAMVLGVFGESGRRVLIEEYLEGPEITVMILSDGKNLYHLPEAQDHKRIFDDDQGPNTGGMGCYSPVPFFANDLARDAITNIMRPTLEAMAAEGRPYVGFLYGGLILTRDGLKVMEFNCRIGDPEAQVVLPRLQGDLVELMEASLHGELSNQEALSASHGAAVCVVMASGGYPGEYETGKLIHGLQEAASIPDVIVFHAATKYTDEGLVTSGGRVLGVTGKGNSLQQAIDKAYQGIAKITFERAHYRKDIARRWVKEA